MYCCHSDDACRQPELPHFQDERIQRVVRQREIVRIDELGTQVITPRVLLQAIEGIGAKVKYVYNNSVQINGGSICDTNVEYDYIRKIRASYYLLGALLGKYNEAHVALPGGCNIGSRPIDQHIKGFKALADPIFFRKSPSF